MKLSKGRMKNSPLKVVIYGPEGIGKSTFASMFPGPLFVDTEGSTRHMDVLRVEPAPASFTELMDMLRQLSGPYLDGYETLVLDTADWAEKLCTETVCANRKMTSIEDAGYGKGYTYVQEEFGKMLNLLTDIVGRGKNVVITAHAQMRKFEQPDELGAYDRWELKMAKKTAAMVKEWADVLLFANYKTMVVNVDNQGAAKGKNKAQGGMRVMYASHHPCWDAKNRFGLPDEMPFDYGQIAHLVPSAPPVPAQPVTPPETPVQPPAEPERETVAKAPAPPQTPQSAPASIPDSIPRELRQLMESDGIGEHEVRKAVADQGYFPEDTPIENYGMEFIMGRLVASWPQVRWVCLELRKNEETPF